MLEIRETTAFKRDVKRAKKRGKDLKKLSFIAEKLAKKEPLEEKYRDHALTGNWKPYRECHIEPDWLLTYIVKGNVLYLARTGSHSDLFK